MNTISYVLSADLNSAVEKKKQELQNSDIVTKIFNKDYRVWKEKKEDDVELSNRLGWLRLPSENLKRYTEFESFAEEAAQEFEHILLLGMGGSSLAPEVFAKTYGSKKNYPTLSIVDSTHPAVIKNISEQYDLTKTLFVVASKSGGTAETMSFFYTFHEMAANQNPLPGLQCISLTDPGSGLEKLSIEKAFRKIFSTPPEVGGRYSALTEFGLVPAALIGMDLDKFLKFAAQMESACSEKNIDENPGVTLGIVLGEAAKAGKDKLTFFASPRIASFPQWVEQLVAESTGKEGVGVMPVADEEFTSTQPYGPDRLFVFLRLDEDDNERIDDIAAKLSASGADIITINLGDIYTLSQEFYRWEMATAVAGAVLGINPFDQPNVQLAKTLANESLAAYKAAGKLPVMTPLFTEEGIEVYADSKKQNLSLVLNELLSINEEGKYVCILGFIPYGAAIEKQMGEIRTLMKDKYDITTTLGYGPRFLHSTGQLHKGGKNNGVYIQITSEIEHDIDVPGQGYSFGVLISAQAQGDLKALQSKGRKVIRLHCKNAVEECLEYISRKL